MVMTIFEALKEPIFGNLTLWQSHIITIIFTSVIVVIFALYTFNVLTTIEHKQLDALLKADQEKFTTMFALSPLGMLRNSMDGIYLVANQAFLDMAGYTLEELKELSYWEITPKKYIDQ